MATAPSAAPIPWAWKHRVDKAVYVFYGSMNPQLAERTGFSDDDRRGHQANPAEAV